MKIQIVESVGELVNTTVLKQSIKKFDAFNDENVDGNPCVFAWNGVSSEMDDDLNMSEKATMHKKYYLCMRPFSDNYKTPTDILSVRVTNAKGRPTIVKSFYDYLFGATSPWKEALPAVAAIADPSNKYGIPKAIVWHNTNLGSSKLVFNLLTAMRLHTCWGLDIVWQRLVDGGFTPEAAILLASNFSFGGQTLTVSNGPAGLFDEDVFEKLSLSKYGCSKTDMPFSTNYNPSGFRRLLKKNPNVSHGTLKQGTPVQPNNFIWHDDDVPTNSDTIDKSSPEFKNSKIKVVQSDPYDLEKYLKDKGKISKSTIKEIEEKLMKNEMLEL